MIDDVFVDYLRVAIADPHSVVGPRLGREGEVETISHWGARAAVVVIRERDRLAGVLICSQCGKRLRDRACGPTHAILTFDPWRHADAPVKQGWQ